MNHRSGDAWPCCLQAREQHRAIAIERIQPLDATQFGDCLLRPTGVDMSPCAVIEGRQAIARRLGWGCTRHRAAPGRRKIAHRHRSAVALPRWHRVAELRICFHDALATPHRILALRRRRIQETIRVIARNLTTECAPYLIMGCKPIDAEDCVMIKVFKIVHQITPANSRAASSPAVDGATCAMP